MTDQHSLPPLPEPYTWIEWCNENSAVFTADQMREYGQACAAHARKAALDSLLKQFNQPYYEYFGSDIQDAIKELL